MTTFIIAKLKKSDDIVKYRIAANITEYHIISKLIFLRITISKFVMISQLFNVNLFIEPVQWNNDLISTV